ncbi:MAG TPA: phosphoadenylyl-sulfate reductase [Candidatus Competibacteraceae bacterium]|nr:phosphoadenylyl-sulfate reductase [Candidatus Competibacteraceae bacterium]
MPDTAPSQDLLEWNEVSLDTLNQQLESMSAEQRVAWALERFPGQVVLSSSFGAQAAVSLHMVTRQCPDIPVILVDTGYLFPETYRFVDELTERLDLNLHIYRAAMSPAWQEARYGKLWEQGLEGIERYNRINKVEPMQRALEELGARAWIAGLRRQQATSRQHLQVLAPRNGRLKIHPLIDWTDRDVYRYLRQHDLPYHPLWHQGYVSIGDVHTTHRLLEGMREEDTRFFGLKRECGLHEHV